MKVSDFMEMCIEEDTQLVEFWSNELGESLWKGYYMDIPEDYEILKDQEICSWNAIVDCGICFNLDV